MFVFSSLTI